MASFVWQWERLGGYSRVMGNTLGDVLADSGLSIAELMAREITQNSDDAMDAYRKEEHAGVHEPTLTFRFVGIVGETKQKFVEQLDLKDLRDRAPNIFNPIRTIDLQHDSCLADLDDPGVPLRLLYVEEYGSVGLQGDPVATPETSRWYNALISQGLSFHEDDRQSGGTRGVGKAAFQLGSKLGMVVAYSHFEPKDDERVSHRLGGFIYQNHHQLTDNGPYYTGFARFGVSQRGEDGETTRPYEDLEAVQLAETIGLSRQAPDNINRYGTSFLLVDPAVEPREISAALETYWWPALQDQTLTIDVIDYDGTAIPPRPVGRHRADLRPYLLAWNLIKGVSQPSSKYETVKEFNRLDASDGPLQLGTIALIADPDTCHDRAFAIETAEEVRSSVVALIRQRRMVIAYEPFFADKPAFVHGVLYSHPDVEGEIARAEPKEHNMWWRQEFPQKVKPEWPALRKLVISTLYSRTYRTLSEFRKTLQIEATEEHVKLERLSRMLGNLFKSRRRGGNPDGPDGAVDPISISLPRPRLLVGADGRSAYTTRPVVRIGDTADFESADTEIEVFFFFEEDTGRQGARLEAEYSNLPDGWSNHESFIVGNLTRSGLSFDVTTRTFSGPFKVRARAQVRAEVPVAEPTRGERV